ncbi:MAG: VOC family protein [Candidatus Sericytochromatia bacterium]|nr:VOC family protein [Candidatus Sericytochromatia bacterium]
MTDSPLGIRHAALAVSDLARSVAFYTDTLGFTPAYVTSADWAMVSMAGTTLSLILVPHFKPPTVNEGGSHPAHLGIVLPSMEAVDDLHRRLGYTDVPTLEAPKHHRDGSYGFYLTDPDGNALESIFIPYRLKGAANAVPSGEAIVLLAHGSSDARWAAPVVALMARLQRHAADIPVAMAFMEFASPKLADVLPGLLAAADIRRVRVVPVFLSSGGHVSHDLPPLITAARAAHPGVDFVLAPAIGEHPAVQDAMASAIIDMLDSH